jgi:anaerobic magnesium-protoporphyrin IX monomethyl ester cyclase
MSTKLALITLYGFEALGVRALHAYLKEKGCDISVLFFKDRAMNEMTPLSDDDLDLLLDKVIEIGADIVGISLFSAMYPDAVAFTRRMRERAPEVIVVWGGYHPTVASEECIEGADVLCVGEGEEPLWELVQRVERGEPYDDIANLWVRMDEGITKNPIRPLIQDLDSLPFFDYQDEGKAYYDEGAWHEGEPFMQATGRGLYFRAHYMIQTSRGCPYGCAYCSNSIFREVYSGCGSYVRQRSVDNIMEQLVEAREIFPEMKKVFFFDEVLVLRKDWLREFAGKYKEVIGLPFKCNLHPNFIDDEVIGLLVDAGLDDLMVGIESGSERVRRDVFNRQLSEEKMLEMARVVHRGGLMPSYNLLVDNPYETREDMDAALEYLLRIPRPYNLRLYSLTHLPNTALTRRLLADGLIQREDVEGYSRKTLERWAVSLGSDAPDSDALHWSTVLSLLPKRLIPKPLIRWMYRSKYLRAKPGPAVAFARVANAVKKGFGALGWLLQGKINLEYIRKQWRSSIRVAR